MVNHPLEDRKLMKKILNNFFNSKIFEILPLIIQKRIRKFSNAYFCLTDNKTLPKNNYKINFSEKYQSFIIENFGTDSYKSKNSFYYLNRLIKNLNFKDFIFLDIGAGDINTFLELKKKCLQLRCLIALKIAPFERSRNSESELIFKKKSNFRKKYFEIDLKKKF